MLGGNPEGDLQVVPRARALIFLWTQRQLVLVLLAVVAKMLVLQHVGDYLGVV